MTTRNVTVQSVINPVVVHFSLKTISEHSEKDSYQKSYRIKDLLTDSLPTIDNSSLQNFT